MADLKKKSAGVTLLYESRATRYALFSRSGFTPHLVRLAQDERKFALINGLRLVAAA